ncbi:MAG: hypothetical protein K1X44_01605 [Alphaproteobacteria bacterium]|nr:hypothetical protein [Alphaproteobacteria bacterium]
MNPRRYTFYLIILVLLFLIPIIVFNFYIDPANLFKSSIYEKKIAALLLQNKNIANIVTYKEKLTQKYIIYETQNFPEVLAFGSSRMGIIDRDFFPNKTFFNHFVTGNTIEDMLAFYGFYKIKNPNYKPEIIIMGLDAWLLNPQYRQNFLETATPLEDGINKGRELIHLTPLHFNKSNLSKYLELISFDYLKASWQDWKKIHKKQLKNSYFITEEKIGEFSIKRSDGSYVYPKKYREMNDTEKQKLMNKYISREYLSGYDGFKELDQEQANIFDSFINYLVNTEHVKLIFYFPPNHNVVYNELKNNLSKYKNFFLAEDYFLSIAKKYNIEIIGDYNPEKCGLNETNFYDPSSHIKIDFIHQAFKKCS